MINEFYLCTTGDFHYKYCLPPIPASAYFSLGADLDLGGKADPEAREFQQAVSSFISCIADFTRALPIYRLVPTPLYYRATKAVQIFYNIGKKYLDSNMEKIQRCVEKGERVKGQSLIEQWMLEKRMSEDEIIISAVGMFGAGVDTVSLQDTCLRGCMEYCAVSGLGGSHLLKFVKGSLLATNKAQQLWLFPSVHPKSNLEHAQQCAYYWYKVG